MQNIKRGIWVFYFFKRELSSESREGISEVVLETRFAKPWEMRSSLEDLDSSFRFSTLWRGLGRNIGVAVAWTRLTLRFVFFLPFHPPVLKPYFYLSFCQTKSMCYLNTSSSCQVSIEVELLLQLKCLVTCIRLPTPFPLCNKINYIYLVIYIYFSNCSFYYYHCYYYLYNTVNLCFRNKIISSLFSNLMIFFYVVSSLNNDIFIIIIIKGLSNPY